MTRWQLTPNSPLALQLAADARLSSTDYFDDQSWELVLGAVGSPALALQTNYGGRAGLVSFLPMWRIDNRAVYEYQAYTNPPEVVTFAPGYVQVSAKITPKLSLRAEFWVMDSHAAGARFTLKNTGAAVSLGVDLLGFAAAGGKELKLGALPLVGGGHAMTLGKLGNLNPVMLLEGGTSTSPNKLSAELQIPANGQVIVHWVHAGLPVQGDSLGLAQSWLKKNWTRSIKKINEAAQAIPVIETGDADTDAAIAFSYQQMVQSLLRPTSSLPYASFVTPRLPGRGFSPRGDGTDHPRGWSGQNPMLAYLMALALAAVSEDMAEGILRNYLAVQKPDGWIDWKPGLAGQQQGVLCLPILARMAWGIWQYTQNDDFLRETFGGLLRFFERWIAEDADKDGFPEWQSEAQTGYPFMPSFSLGLPWGQNADIRYFETPSLMAYLLSEAISLREIAYYLMLPDDEKRLIGRIDNLSARLEKLWNASEKRYAYRDRDTHATTGSVSVLQDGRGDEEHILAQKLDPPNRLIVQVTGGTSQMPNMKLRLSGIDAGGNRVQEDADAFVWTQSRGVYVSKTVFSQIDRIRIEGLAGVYRISARTVATDGFDLNGLLPLWSVGIPPERAAALVEHLVNPAEFLRANGTLMFTAKDPYYNPAPASAPASAEGSLGVWVYWVTLMGEGLIENRRVDLATDLLKRLLAAQTAVLLENKAFSEYYHADQPKGLGERGNVLGVVPLHLLLRVLGVRITSKSRVWTGGAFAWGQPVTITQHGVTVTRTAGGTTIRFPSGDTVNLPADAPWQEVIAPRKP